MLSSNQSNLHQIATNELFNNDMLKPLTAFSIIILINFNAFAGVGQRYLCKTIQKLQIAEGKVTELPKSGDYFMDWTKDGLVTHWFGNSSLDKVVASGRPESVQIIDKYGYGRFENGYLTSVTGSFNGSVLVFIEKCEKTDNSDILD